MKKLTGSSTVQMKNLKVSYSAQLKAFVTGDAAAYRAALVKYNRLYNKASQRAHKQGLPALKAFLQELNYNLTM